jgi:hypothetical protein
MTALGVEMTEKKVDPELAKRLKDKLENELIPKLQSQKIRTRTVIAVNVIALVDRQIGKAEGPLEGEWDKLRGFVQDQPKALKLINDLQAAILKYDQELREKSTDTEADEDAMRKTANGIIRQAVMAKLKSLQDADRAEDAAEAAVATDAVVSEVSEANAADGVPPSPLEAELEAKKAKS